MSQHQYIASTSNLAEKQVHLVKAQRTYSKSETYFHMTIPFTATRSTSAEHAPYRSEKARTSNVFSRTHQCPNGAQRFASVQKLTSSSF